MKNYILLLILVVLSSGTGEKKPVNQINEEFPATSTLTYDGTASITQGLAKTLQERIYECERGRKTDIGIITSTDDKEWTVPASNNFTNGSFPFASDLHNPCNGNTYDNVQTALSKLDGSDIINIDKGGSVFTAYVFADNYFEMYINGIPVGKDNVPFTQFNSNIVRFKASRPFTVVMKLIDWEENLGLGTEGSRGSAHHAGDGGMVAVIKDAEEQIVAITNKEWKAQTFYTAPIKDLSCVAENGALRSSSHCDESDSDDGASYYGLHWELPEDWEKEGFDDSNWPSATTYSNQTIGVDNKKSYTNFVDIFDDQSNDAQFIWSSNVVLDNEVVVRYTVK